jgi:hypothetical protein
MNEHRTGVYRFLFEGVRPQLEAAGFVNGMYGELPFDIEWPANPTEYAMGNGIGIISVDKRKIGYIECVSEGKQVLYTNFAGWMRGDSDGQRFVAYEDIGFSIYNSAGLQRIVMRDKQIANHANDKGEL